VKISPASLQPANVAPVVVAPIISPSVQPLEKDQIVALKETLAVFFFLEYVVLVEFVECCIPFMYSLYLLACYYSSNAPYLYGTRNKSPEEFHEHLRSMCLYGLPEIGTLLVLWFLVKKRFGFNIFDLLAFGLETNFACVQGKLVFFSITLLALGRSQWIPLSKSP
jgi:hypothetical protein